MTLGTSFEQLNLLAPRMLRTKISMHSGKRLMRRRFMKCFSIKTYIKISPLRAWPFLTPGTVFEQT